MSISFLEKMRCFCGRLSGNPATFRMGRHCFQGVFPGDGGVDGQVPGFLLFRIVNDKADAIIFFRESAGERVEFDRPRTASRHFCFHGDPVSLPVKEYHAGIGEAHRINEPDAPCVGFRIRIHPYVQMRAFFQIGYVRPFLKKGGDAERDGIRGVRTEIDFRFWQSGQPRAFHRHLSLDLDSSVLGEGAVLNQKAQGEYAFACFLFIGMMGNADGRVFQRNSISASDAQSCWTGSCREYGAGGSVTAGE